MSEQERQPTPIFLVDAFAEEPFRGNPAGVCLLEEPRPEAWMQNLAAEMNVSETAFVVPEQNEFGLRWFTPTQEVPLCGHATLASAHVLWETGALGPDQPARFRTRSGVLTARRSGPRIEIDLPARSLREAEPPAAALQALGLRPRWCGRTPEHGLGDVDYLLELGSEEAVRGARPDFAGLKTAQPAGYILTAGSASPSCDFVSRYFASAFGIDEDPVTGAAHCTLVPFWASRLGKTDLVGYQASARGGFVHARLRGDRALLSGGAVTVLRGTLAV